jgi:hypothetical protein
VRIRRAACPGTEVMCSLTWRWSRAVCEAPAASTWDGSGTSCRSRGAEAWCAVVARRPVGGEPVRTGLVSRTGRPAPALYRVIDPWSPTTRSAAATIGRHSVNGSTTWTLAVRAVVIHAFRCSTSCENQAMGWMSTATR